MARREADTTVEAGWGQLLIVPIDGYLEACGGPTPVRDVEWVEISMSRVKGGIAGRPLEMVDAKDEILSALDRIQQSGELLQSTWSVHGIFKDQPVQVFRILNPFGPIPRNVAG